MELFLASFTSFFVIIDPIGTAAVFFALTQSLDKKESRFIAFKAIAIAIALMLLFAFWGKALLGQVGISFDAFRIAGGLLLFVTAFRMIMGLHDAPSIKSEESVYSDNSNLAVFPLAIPLLAGPGCLAAMVLNMDLASNTTERASVISAMIGVEVFTLICMLLAACIVRLIGNTGASIIARLMGILLAALSVQFIADGTMNLIHSHGF